MANWARRPQLIARTLVECRRCGRFRARPELELWCVGEIARWQTAALMMARMDEGNDFRGWDMWQQGRNIAAHFIHKWPMNALKMMPRPIIRCSPNEWQHVFVTYDGSGKPEGVQIYVDGKAAKIAGRRRGQHAFRHHSQPRFPSASAHAVRAAAFGRRTDSRCARLRVANWKRAKCSKLRR